VGFHLKEKVMEGVMSTSWRVGALMVLAGAVAGCIRTPEAPVRTVTYFRAHAAERHDWLAHCQDDPGSLGHSANCVNADQAESVEGIGSFKDLPPMGLLPASPARSASDGSTHTPSVRP
jgi:hypothetical protein